MTAEAQELMPVPDEDHSNGAAWTSVRARPVGLPDHIRPWTPAEQAEHLAVLAEAITGWRWHDPARVSARRTTARHAA